MSVIVNGNEITLIGTVGGDPWFDPECFSHADVLGALAQVGRDAAVTVHVNSGGGVSSEGAAIHAAFAQHKGDVTMIVEGWACSAASLFVMAGKTIRMAPGALMMIHNPAAYLFGTAADHRAAAAALDVMSGVYAQVYADRCEKPVAEVRALMDAETWMGPDEAVKLGFADAADEPVNDNATAPEPVAYAHVKAYAHVPERIVALAQSRGWTSRVRMAAPPAAPTRQQEIPTMTEQPKPAGTEAPATPTTPTAADPVMIAEACTAAGYPGLIASMLKTTGITMAAVNARIEEAKGIADAATKVGLPKMAGSLIASGVSLETARAILFDAKATADEAIVTDPTPPAASMSAGSGWGSAVAKLGGRK